ncbi:MAG: MFS transporter [Simkaniaceae bacterium]|nr:MFS transporter [Simkaniaceae bacterium]
MSKKLPSIPGTVWGIGFVALLVNLSSIMIYSLSPLFLTHVFGLSILYLGLLEGVIEFTAWATRIFAGVISDYFRKRKPILIFAYFIILCTRPIFALGSSISWIYSAKIMDRFANGIQATPREALVGDVAPKEIKGACYGMRQSLGVFGSVLGAGAVTLLMRSTGNDYRLIFWIASIPMLLALGALLLFVKETPHVEIGNVPRKDSEKSFSNLFQNLLKLDRGYWILLFVAGIFMVSNYGATYRIIQAEKLGFSAANIAIIMIVQNFGIMLSSFPIGKLSDTFHRRFLLGVGFAIAILSNLVWTYSQGQLGALTATALWGIQMGITQSLIATMVADAAGKELRGTAFGIYYFVTGVALFLANSLTGWLFDFVGPTSAYLGSTLFAGLAICLLPAIPSRELAIQDHMLSKSDAKS